MGSSAILIAAVALGISLVCFFFGYRLGRSKVRLQLEDALNAARISADAREYEIREQLDEMMIEVGKFRAHAEQAGSVEEQVEQATAGMPDSSNSNSSNYDAARFSNSPEPEREIPVRLPEKGIAIASISGLPVDSPASFSRQESKPAQAKASAPTPPPPRTPAPTPPRAKSSGVRPRASAADEWDEFEASLKALNKTLK